MATVVEDTLFNVLPEICRYLGLRDLHRVSMVCRRWRQLFMSGALVDSSWLSGLGSSPFFTKGTASPLETNDNVVYVPKEGGDSFGLYDFAYKEVTRQSGYHSGVITSILPLMPVPLPPYALCYFEVLINSMPHCTVGIGYGSTHAPNTYYHPGWYSDSYGYHGDDGRTFHEQSWGRRWGPVFGYGHIVGCGLDLREHKIFYTRNGYFLGFAFDVEVPVETLLPYIALYTSEDSVTVNLGYTKRFAYDLEMYASDMNYKVIWEKGATIQSKQPPPFPTPLCEPTNPTEPQSGLSENSGDL
ncbi:Ran-binding protein 9 [Pelomyxa schiedti]|nr:Ran-binding protein 9 [Pelomyxa schiedti]